MPQPADVCELELRPYGLWKKILPLHVLSTASYVKLAFLYLYVLSTWGGAGGGKHNLPLNIAMVRQESRCGALQCFQILFAETA